MIHVSKNKKCWIITDNNNKEASHSKTSGTKMFCLIFVELWDYFKCTANAFRDELTVVYDIKPMFACLLLQDAGKESNWLLIYIIIACK